LRSFLALPAIIKHGRKGLAMTNTPTYFAFELIAKENFYDNDCSFPETNEIFEN
jgi:hypothetical protein